MLGYADLYKVCWQLDVCTCCSGASQYGGLRIMASAKSTSSYALTQRQQLSGQYLIQCNRAEARLGCMSKRAELRPLLDTFVWLRGVHLGHGLSFPMLFQQLVAYLTQKQP